MAKVKVNKDNPKKEKLSKNKKKKELSKYEKRFGEGMIPRKTPFYLNEKIEDINLLVFSMKPHQIDAIQVLKLLKGKIKNGGDNLHEEPEMQEKHEAFQGLIEGHCQLNNIDFKRTYQNGILPLVGTEGCYYQTLVYYLMCIKPKSILLFLTKHVESFFPRKNRKEIIENELIDLIEASKLFKSHGEMFKSVEEWILKEGEKNKTKKHPDLSTVNIEDVIVDKKFEKIIFHILEQYAFIEGGVWPSNKPNGCKLKALNEVLHEKQYFTVKGKGRTGMALNNWLGSKFLEKTFGERSCDQYMNFYNEFLKRIPHSTDILK